MNDEFVVLENRISANHHPDAHYFYGKVRHIKCFDQEQLIAALTEIDHLRREGYYLVGFISYEAAYFLDRTIIPAYQLSSEFPLLHFMVFEQHQQLTQGQIDNILLELQGSSKEESFIYNNKFSFSENEYTALLKNIERYIYEGHSYQINITGKYHFHFQGCPIAYYRLLRARQKVAYSGLLNFGTYQVLSLSPELFFNKRQSTLITKPMKGTMPRGRNKIEDETNKRFLTTDPKSIAENVMIVDLLRNDLNTIAHPGSVMVSDIFQVESYETMHQMISTVSANVDIDIPFKNIIANIFPCGSVTGAPKKRTMQIIHALEKEPRNLYTGAIGFITPNNDMCFNVAIRTILLAHGRGELGVGGGILSDSNPENEYAEVQLKAKFLTGLAKEFKLLECFLYSHITGYRYLSSHLARLKKSAAVFGFHYPFEVIEQLLAKKAQALDKVNKYKIRLELDWHGAVNLEAIVLNNSKDDKPLRLLFNSEYVIDSTNVLYQHKTTYSSIRNLYDTIYSESVGDKNIFDVFFANEQGYLTEGTKCNIYIKRKGEILTPAIKCGVLGGIMREQLINSELNIKEDEITINDLHTADEIWVSNSIIGFQRAELC